MLSEKTRAVQRMQDYIAAHLHDSVNLNDLAEEAGYSPFHASRLFKALTGFAPRDYIRRMRLSAAAQRLRTHKCSVMEAALEAGYDSAEGFQRAFFREFSCNPGEYARRPIPVPLFVSYGVKFRELWKEPRVMTDIVSVFIQVVEKPLRKAVIKRGVKADEYWSYCKEVGCDIWGLLTSMDFSLGEPVCLWLPDKMRLPGTSQYVQGVEVAADFSGAIPEGFEVIDLPAAHYLLFQGEPFAEVDYIEAIKSVQQSMDKYDPRLIGYCWDDSNPRIQLEPRCERGYMEMRAVKKL